MNEWCIYIALCVLLYTQSAVQSCVCVGRGGGFSPQPPPVCSIQNNMLRGCPNSHLKAAIKIFTASGHSALIMGLTELWWWDGYDDEPCFRITETACPILPIRGSSGPDGKPAPASLSISRRMTSMSDMPTALATTVHQTMLKIVQRSETFQSWFGTDLLIVWRRKKVPFIVG